MIPASTNGGGQCFAFPDICKTPTPGGPVPIPYPNIAMNTDINLGTAAKKVKISGSNAAMVQTKIMMSTGDEAGAVGGVVSSKIKGEAEFIMGYPKVMIEGKMAAMMGSPATHNGSAPNAVGAQIVPSQAKVLYSPVPVVPGGPASFSGKPGKCSQEKLKELEQEEWEPGTIKLSVKNCDGDPIPQTKIKIQPEGKAAFFARTDEQGKINLDEMPKGKFKYWMVDFHDNTRQ